jgi:hypothetical protein
MAPSCSSALCVSALCVWALTVAEGGSGEQERRHEDRTNGGRHPFEDIATLVMLYHREPRAPRQSPDPRLYRRRRRGARAKTVTFPKPPPLGCPPARASWPTGRSRSSSGGVVQGARGARRARGRPADPGPAAPAPRRRRGDGETSTSTSISTSRRPSHRLPRRIARSSSLRRPPTSSRPSAPTAATRSSGASRSAAWRRSSSAARTCRWARHACW